MKKNNFINMMWFTLSRKRTYSLYILLIIAIACKDDEELLTDDITITDDVVNTDDNVAPEEGFTVQYTSIYGGSQVDTFQAITATPDGGFAALGHTQSVDGDVTDNDSQINKLWLVKADQDGAIQWSKTYGGSEDSRGTKVITTTDGGYAILGYSESSDGDMTENAGFYDHWIAKLDAQGNILWQKSYGFSGSDQAYGLIQTTDGGFFTSGFLDVTASQGEGNDGIQDPNNTNDNTRATLHGVGEFWGHKLDANGNLVWRRYYGGTNNDRSYEALQAPDGGILMVGNSESNDFDISDSQGSYDFWAVRLSASGDLLWERSLGGSQIEIAYTATTTSDGAYLLAGDTRSSDGDVTNFRGSADVWLVKLSDQGELLWQKTLGGSNFETTRSITQTPDGYAITGASRSLDGQVTTNNGQNDIWVVSIDQDGELLKQQSFGGNGQDFGYGITATTDGTLIIAGDTDSTSGPLVASKGATDAVIIKLN